jgi:hypothetical protein
MMDGYPICTCGTRLPSLPVHEWRRSNGNIRSVIYIFPTCICGMAACDHAQSYPAHLEVPSKRSRKHQKVFFQIQFQIQEFCFQHLELGLEFLRAREGNIFEAWKKLKKSVFEAFWTLARRVIEKSALQASLTLVRSMKKSSSTHLSSIF